MQAVNPGNLLIVDDTPANLRLLCDMLGTEGYRLRPFSKPLPALESARSDPPDLFILDVSMPEVDGFEFCSRLKSDPRTVDIPVIFLSAQRSTSQIVEGFRRGAVDYITKPFQFEEVATRVATHLALRRAKVEIDERNRALETALADLREAQSQLVHSEKMASLGVLTAGVAHEINNPINFIAANASVLRRKIEKFASRAAGDGPQIEPEDFAVLKELAGGFEEGATRIADIVESLKLYARIDEDVFKPYDARKNIMATLRVFQHELRHGVALTVNIDDLPELQANPGRINQVLANLLSNAIGATREGSTGEPRIEILVTDVIREGSSYWGMEVIDNGPGVSEALRDRVFEPFFTSKEPGQGLGLGLSISRSIVEAHGGWIELDSCPGRTVFRVLLPFERG